MSQSDHAEIICAMCGKKFDAHGMPSQSLSSAGIVALPPTHCRECQKFIEHINKTEERLIKKEFSLEHDDEKIAEQLHGAINDANTSSDDFRHWLLKRMIQDAQRRERIIIEIAKLEAKKKRR